MLYKNILVPFDGSEPARGALAVAKKLIADDPDSVLCILSVIPVNAIAAELEYPSNAVAGTPLMFPDMDSYERVISSARKSAEDELAHGLEGELDDVECKVVTDVYVSSKVAEGIVEYAEEHGSEIIVMGRRGLGALRGMLGSVSYAVLHQADIPVLTVK